MRKGRFVPGIHSKLPRSFLVHISYSIRLPFRRNVFQIENIISSTAHFNDNDESGRLLIAKFVRENRRQSLVSRSSFSAIFHFRIIANSINTRNANRAIHEKCFSSIELLPIKVLKQLLNQNRIERKDLQLRSYPYQYFRGPFPFSSFFSWDNIFWCTGRGRQNVKERWKKC